MKRPEELLAELAGIVEDVCRIQAATWRKIAEHTDLPAGLRKTIVERVRFVDLNRSKVQKFIAKVKALGEEGRG